MLKTYGIKTRRFEADQIGIDQMKNEFLIKARKFVYFRKGGWRGVERSIKDATKWVQTHPDHIYTALLYQATEEIIQNVAKATGVPSEWVTQFLNKKYIHRRNYHKKLITTRAICCKGSVSKSKISDWERISEMKGSV